MMYSKQQQIGKRSKPKRQKRTQIKERDYRKMIELWGEGCIYCGNPNIEAHHVKFRSAGGKGRYTNLLPLCQHHHQDVHRYDFIRKSLEYKLEQTFGQWYYCDEFDLHDKGLIDHPTVSEYDRYFEEGL